MQGVVVEVPLANFSFTSHLKVIETPFYSIGQKGIIHCKKTGYCPLAYDHIKHVRSVNLKLCPISDPDALVADKPKFYQKCKSCFPAKTQAWKETEWIQQEVCRPFYLSGEGVELLKKFRSYRLHAAYTYGNYNFCYCNYYYLVVSCQIREVKEKCCWSDEIHFSAWGDGIQVKCDKCGLTGWTHWQYLYKLVLLNMNPETGLLQEVVVYKNPANRPDIWF